MRSLFQIASYFHLLATRCFGPRTADRWFAPQRQLARKQSLFKPQTQRLEERLCFSAVTWSLNQSTLTIQGSADTDQVSVVGGNTLQVVTAPQTIDTGIDPGVLTRLTVFGNAGDDRIEVDQSLDHISAQLYGGDGNDNLISAGGADVLYGQDGDDLLRGGGGNDNLVGGNGADVSNDLVSGVATASLNSNQQVATIANRRVFYNGATGANLSSVGDAENSIASDKSALLPGSRSTFANYTSYSRGLNGFIVDINNLPATTTDSQILSSLQFAQWNGIDASGFSMLPVTAVPTATILAGSGVGGSTRVKITFPDNTLQNTWLRVTVVANAATALPANDVFYFGNVVGETGVGNTATRLRVNGQDTNQILLNQSPGANSASVTNVFDLNRDGRVNGQDTNIMLNNQQPAGIVGVLSTSSVFLTSGNMIYNGEAYQPTATVMGDTGLISSPGLTYSYFVGTGTTGVALGATPPSQAGVYTVVAKYLGNSTYAASDSIPATFEITQRILNVTATGIDRLYNSTVNASVSLSDDKIAGDNVIVGFASAAFVDKNVGTNKLISVNGLTVSGADAGNYSIVSSTVTTVANISERVLHVMAMAEDKAFDGTTTAIVSLEDDRILGDATAVSFVSANFADAAVGNDKIVTVAGLNLTGTDAANYVLASTTITTTASITSVSNIPTLSVDGFDFTAAFVNFGTSFATQNVVRTLRVTNNGSSDLVVQPAVFPAGFSTTANFSAGQVIAPGASAALPIRIDTSSAGYRSGALQLVTNGSLVPIDVQLAGGIKPFNASVIIVDDDTTASFKPFDASGVASAGDIWVVANRPDLPVYRDVDGVADYRFAAGRSEFQEPVSFATWTFKNVPAGTYAAFATWHPFSSRATNAQYTFTSGGGQSLGSATANQQVTPTSLFANGVNWQQLTQVTSADGTVVVKLSNHPTARVTADAIRLERVVPDPNSGPIEGIETITVTSAGQPVSSSNPVTFSSAFGQTSTATITYTNNGSGPAVLSPIPATASPFSVTSNIPVGTWLAPGESTSIVVSYASATAGSHNATLNLPLNIDNANTSIAIALQGVTAAPNQVPTTSPSTINTPQDTSFVFTLAHFPFSDADASDSLTSVRIESLATAGNLTLAGTPVVIGQDVSAVDIASGQLLFTPVSGAFGAPYSSFSFSVSDGEDRSLSATITINVVPSGVTLTAPALIGPAFFTGLNTPTISWRPVQFAISYRVAIVDDATGLTVVNEVTTGTTFTPSSPLSTGAYSVDVAAMDITGELGLASTSRAFFAGTGTSSGIVDDADAGFTSTTGWTTAPESTANDGNQTTSPAGVGNEVAAWMIAADPGRYQVDVTWAAIAGAATNARYTIFDGTEGRILASIVVDQSQSPSGTGGWLTLGNFTAISGQIVVQLTDEAGGVVVADAIRIAPTLVPDPILGLKPTFNDKALPAGLLNFGGISQSTAPVLRELQIENTNLQTVTVAAPTVTGGFVVQSGPAVGTELAPGQVVTYVIAMPTNSVGYFTGNFSLGLTGSSNSSTGGSALTLDIPLLGGVGPSGAEAIVVDNDENSAAIPFNTTDNLVGSSSFPAWAYVDFFGVDGDHHYSGLPDSTAARLGFADPTPNAIREVGEAIWMATNLPDGTYRVWASWPNNSLYTATVDFVVRDSNDQTLAQQPVNQAIRVADPAAPSVPGGRWMRVFDTVTVTGGILKVAVSNDVISASANNLEVAVDAIRIQQLDAAPHTDSAQSLTVVVGGQTLQSGQILDVGYLPPGATFVTQTATITNNGFGPVILQPFATDEPGVTFITNLDPDTVLAPGTSRDITFEVAPVATGRFTAALLATTDYRDSALGIHIVGSGSPSVADTNLIDNGGVGFDYDGNSNSTISAGYDGSALRMTRFVGDSESNATWTFSGLTPGRYRVLAAHPTPNPATPDTSLYNQAPFEVRVGSKVITSATIDQTVPADDYLYDGVHWEAIGEEFVIQSSEVVVRLRDGELPFLYHVYADAVILQRLPSADVTDIISAPAGLPFVDVDVLANDAIPDGVVPAIVIMTPFAGTLIEPQANGKVRVRPDSPFVDQVTFQYQYSYGTFTSGTISATVNFTAAAPIAVADAFTVSHGVDTTIDPRFNDVDPQGDSLTIHQITAPTYGSVAMVDGVIRYTPDFGHFGEVGPHDATFAYTITDGQSISAPATVTVHVGNTAPTFSIADRLQAIGVNVDTADPLQSVLNVYDEVDAFDADGDRLELVVTELDGTRLFNPPLRLADDPDGVGYVITFDSRVGFANGGGSVNDFYRVALTDGVATTAFTQVWVTAYHHERYQNALSDPNRIGSAIESLVEFDTAGAFRTLGVLPRSVSLSTVASGPSLSSRAVTGTRASAALTSIGGVDVSLQTGAVTTSHGLDLNLGPAGNDFALIYNSETVDPRPVVQATLNSFGGGPLRVELTVDDTGNALGRNIPLVSQANTTTRFLTASQVADLTDADGNVRLAIQPEGELDGVGAYDYRLRVYFTDQTGPIDELNPPPSIVTFGEMVVAERDDTDEPAFAGFGRGWSISGVTRLYTSAGATSGLLTDPTNDPFNYATIVTADGQQHLFVAGIDETLGELDGTYRPIELDHGPTRLDQFGTLARDLGTGVFTYNDASGVVTTFGNIGAVRPDGTFHQAVVQIEPLSGPDLTFAYDSDGRIATIHNIDWAVTTFGYSGGLLSSIATGGRTYVIDTVATTDNDVVPFEPMFGLTPPDGPPVRADQASAELRGISEDGRLRSFAYTDGKLHTVTNHAGASGNNLITTVGYDAAGLAQSVEFGGSLYTVVPVAAVGLRPGTTLTNGQALATVTEPTSDLQRLDASGNPVTIDYLIKTDYQLDQHGRTLATERYTTTLGPVISRLETLSKQTFSRNAYGDVFHTTDPLGRVTATTYDYDNARPGEKFFGNVTEVFRDYVIAAYDYTADTGLVETMTDSRGAVTTYTYQTGTDLVTRIDGPEGIVELFTYDANALLETHTDARGLVTTYSYRANRNVATATTAADPVTGQRMQTQYAYDGNGNLQTTTDRYSNGGAFIDRGVTRTDFDDFGRLQSTRIEGGDGNALSHVAYVYQDNGLLAVMGTFLSDPGASFSLTADDPATAADADVILAKYSYNDRGQNTSTIYEADDATDANLTLTESASYYADGSLRSTLGIDGTLTEVFYDPTDFTSWSRTDSIAAAIDAPTGHAITRTTTDAIGRPIEQFDALTGTLQSQTYDRFDRLTAVTTMILLTGLDGFAARPVTNRYSYDATGNLLQSRSPGSAPNQTVYDLASRPVASAVVTAGSVGTVGIDNIGMRVWNQYSTASDLVAETEFRHTPTTRYTPGSDTEITTTMQHDVFGRTIAVIDPSQVTATSPNGETRYTYEIANFPGHLGLMQTTVVARNGTTAVQFNDTVGRTVETVDASGAVSNFTYDLAGRMTQQRLRSGTAGANIDRSAVFAYDALSRQRRSEIVSGGQSIVVTDDFTLGSGQSTHVQQQQFASGPSATTQTTTTTTVSDGVGQLVSRRTNSPGSGNQNVDQLQKFGYTHGGNRSVIVTQTTIDGGDMLETTATLNAAGGLLATTDNSGNPTVTNTYPLSRKDLGTVEGVAKTAPLNLSVPGLIADAGSRLGIGEISDIGRSVIAADADGQVSLFITNPVTGGTLLSRAPSQEQIANVELMDYDSAGNLVELIDSSNNATGWTYDVLSRPTAEIVQLDTFDSVGIRTGQRQYQSTWQYDGLTTTSTDRLGRVIRTTIDPTNLSSTTDWLDNLSGPVIETYASSRNADGTLRATSNSLGHISFTYDALGRTDLITQNVTFAGSSVPTITLDYDHNELNQRTQTVFRLGGVDQLTERFFYDQAGRIRSIDQTGPAVTDTSAAFTFTPEGRISQVQRSLGGLVGGGNLTASVLTTDYGYEATDNADRLLQSIVHTAPAGWDGVSGSPSNDVAAYDFTYDDLYRIKSLTANQSFLDGTDVDTREQVDGYEYDRDGQLIAHRTALDGNYVGVNEFDFDDTGNRVDEGGKAGLHNRQTEQGDWRYGYDAEGNRTVKVYKGDPANAPQITRTTYAYDHINRPVTIQHFDAAGTLEQEIHYGYDALGRRVARNVLDNVLGSLTESDYDIFVWEGDQVLAELTRDHASDPTADTLATTYFNGPGTDQLLAVEDHTGEIDDVVWTLADHLGSIRTYVTLDESTGKVTGAEQLVYTAFGQEQQRLGNDIGTDEILIARFTGREYDAAAELYYYRNRYYDAALGRFLTEDPIGFAGGDANLSRYVGNDPVNSTDPSGLQERPNGFDELVDKLNRQAKAIQGVATANGATINDVHVFAPVWTQPSHAEIREGAKPHLTFRIVYWTEEPNGLIANKMQLDMPFILQSDAVAGGHLRLEDEIAVEHYIRTQFGVHLGKAMVKAGGQIVESEVKGVATMAAGVPMIASIGPIRQASRGPAIVNSRQFREGFETAFGAPTTRRFSSVDDLNAAANSASPNTRYEFGSYSWTTDAHGRVSVAQGQVRLGDAGRSSLQTTIGNEGASTDIGFHLIAHSFDAPTNRLNVVPGNGVRLADGLPNLNQGTYKSFENQLRRSVRDGDSVDIKIETIYGPANLSTRPDYFVGSYRINGGDWVTHRFPNKR